MSKIKVSVLKSPLKETAAKSVHIEKLENGFVVRTCGLDGEQSEYVKNLASTPSIISRLMGIKDKSGKEIEEITDVEEEKEED